MFGISRHLFCAYVELTDKNVRSHVLVPFLSKSDLRWWFRGARAVRLTSAPPDSSFRYCQESIGRCVEACISCNLRFSPLADSSPPLANSTAYIVDFPFPLVELACRILWVIPFCRSLCSHAISKACSDFSIIFSHFLEKVS